MASPSRPDTTPPGAPGGVRIRALRDRTIHESHDPGEVPALLADAASRVWIDLTDPSPDVVEHVAGAIGIHPLVAEDIIESNQRAKFELIDSVIHVVVFALTRPDQIRTSEVDLVLGERYLLSVHTRAWDPWSVHQLKLGLATILGRGPDFLLWALLDGIVDAYFPVFGDYADEIEDLQDRIVEDPSPETLQRVFAVKRELIRLRHVVHPSREVLSRLTSRESELIGEQQVFYFRDVYDHLIRLTDEFDSLRELVAGALEVYLSTVNNNLSAIMKRLTAVTVVLAGIAAVAGLFGMSEAGAAFGSGENTGFWVVVIVTVVLAFAAVLGMRRLRWI